MSGALPAASALGTSSTPVGARIAASQPLLLPCVRGDGSATTLAPGVLVYVWSEDQETNEGKRPGNLRAAFEDARDELLIIKPDGVCIHASPSGLLARGADGVRALDWVVREVRALLPGVRVWVGVGADGWVDDWRAGKATQAQVLTPLRDVALVCARLAVEAIVWNCEVGWKYWAGNSAKPGDKRTRAELEQLARLMVAEVCAAAPLVVHILSSYDHVGMHMAMPWRGLVSGNLVLVTGQNYVAVKGGARKGALRDRIASAQRSQDAARRTGQFQPRAVFPTVQLYLTHPGELCSVLVSEPIILGWALPRVPEGGRADNDGVRAAAAAVAIRRAVGAGPDAVRRFQAAAGGALTVDGDPGPRTQAWALGERS